MRRSRRVQTRAWQARSKRPPPRRVRRRGAARRSRSGSHGPAPQGAGRLQARSLGAAGREPLCRGREMHRSEMTGKSSKRARSHKCNCASFTRAHRSLDFLHRIHCGPIEEHKILYSRRRCGEFSAHHRRDHPQRYQPGRQGGHAEPTRPRDLSQAQLPARPPTTWRRGHSRGPLRPLRKGRAAAIFQPRERRDRAPCRL